MIWFDLIGSIALLYLFCCIIWAGIVQPVTGYGQ